MAAILKAMKMMLEELTKCEGYAVLYVAGMGLFIG